MKSLDKETDCGLLEFLRLGCDSILTDGFRFKVVLHGLILVGFHKESFRYSYN